MRAQRADVEAGVERGGPGPLDVLVVAEQLRRRVPGGIGTYLRGLLMGLELLGDGVAVTLWASRHRSRSADPLSGLVGPGRLATSALPGPLVTRAWDRGIGGPRTRSGRIDVVHAPSLAVPPRRKAALTAMVHDLAWQHEPEAYPARGRRWHEAALHRAIDRADLLVVPSTDTADDLLGAGATARRVEVVEEGCDHLPAPDDVAAADLLGRLGIDAEVGYMLTVSTLEPRKNLVRLLRAHALARPRLDVDLPLVVVGPTGWGPALQSGDAVVLAGAVTGATLAGLYAGARLLASVPLREGFGLPPLEAMGLGTPVVASPMPSTAGAAHEVSPLDVDAIADALVAVATDTELRADLIARGHERAAALTWRRTAAAHVELWRGLGR